MKILNLKEHHDPTANLTCRKCGTEMEVTKADIASERVGNYIKCPSCGEFNAAPLALFPDLLTAAYFAK